MSTTAQISIAMKDANNYVNESLNDIYVTQYGQHWTVRLPANTSVVIQWPLYGETSLYVKWPMQAGAYTVQMYGSDSTTLLWAGTIPIQPNNAPQLFVPMLLPKPDPIGGTGTNNIYLKTSIVIQNLPMVFF